MGNGFKVTLKEFEKLPIEQKMTALFHNTDTILEKLLEGKEWQDNHEKSDNLHHKLQYWFMGILASLYGVLKFFKIV